MTLRDTQKWSLALALCLAFVQPSWAQDAEKPEEAENPPAAAPADDAKKTPPQTTDDPKIPTDQLDLLLQPLTQEELVIEADGWRDLLKSKVAEISELEVQRKRANRVVEKAAEDISDEAKEKAPPTEEAPPPAANAVTPDAEAPLSNDDAQQKAAVAEQAKAQKEAVLDRVPELQEEKTALIDRLNTVLKALEAKGGKIDQYKTYIAAVSGINIDTTDASATWTAVTGWLNSEEGGRRWLWNFGKFFGILFASFLLSRIIGGLVYRAMRAMPKVSTLLRDFVSRFAKQAVMFLGLLAALAALEVNIGPVLAAIAAAGLVVGLALQDTLSNFASGLLMLAYRPFDVGHVIEAGGITGKVESMNMVSTHIKTFDNRHVVVPNSQIWGGTITNASVSDTRRVDLTIGIGYQDDIAKAQEILERIVRDNPKVLDDPAPIIRVSELAESSVNLICLPWCNAADFGEVKAELLRSVKDEFDRNGISIPYPQRDIYVHQIAENAVS